MIESDIVSVRRNGSNALLLTIRQPFYAMKQTSWESCSLFGFIFSSLSITSILVIGVVQANHLYAGANFQTDHSIERAPLNCKKKHINR